jgi:hypothetical protein
MTNGLQMSISLSGREIKTNQPCVLLIRYRNVSTNEVFQIFETAYDPTYAFTVTSPSEINISPDMTMLQESDSGQVHWLNPGQTVAIEFNLSAFCRFDEPGIYKLVAKRERIWSTKEHQDFTVVSNPLKITVTN